MFKHSILFILTFLSISLSARETIYKDANANAIIVGTNMVRYTDHSSLPNYIQFRTHAGPKLVDMVTWMNQSLGLKSNYGFIELNRTKDALGFEHIRYRQTYNQVPIQGSMYIAHTRNGIIESFSGIIYNDIPNLNIQPSLNEANTLNLALNKVNANLYKWQVAEEEQFLKVEENDLSATYYPKATLFILKQNNVYHLCHAFNIYAHEPMGRTMEYIDAHSGKIILSKNLIEHIGVNGTAVTKYSGIKPFQTDSVSPTNFRLRDATRGIGVNTYNMLTGTTTAGSVDFTDANNYWNNVNAAKDEAATDAHWGLNAPTIICFQNIIEIVLMMLVLN